MLIGIGFKQYHKSGLPGSYINRHYEFTEVALARHVKKQ
jgi:hypothetical protein